MAKVVETVAKKLNLPVWWIESVAVEYTECRHYATANEIWSFDFDMVTEAALEHAVRSHKIVASSIIVHNVDRDTYAMRAIERLFTNLPVQMAQEKDDVIANGPISTHHFPFLANPIDRWDPKLSFPGYFQVLDGGLWQWAVGEFVEATEARGKWVASEINLEPLDQVTARLAALQRRRVKPGEPGYADFQGQVKAFYQWVDGIRRQLLADLEVTHKRRCGEVDYSKAAVEAPPVLSRFEMYTVRERKILTQFFAEAIFYRGCYEHSSKAMELSASAANQSERLAKLDEMYQERAVAIILGGSCAESFINGLIAEHYPSLWRNVEALMPVAKYQLLFTLKGKGDEFVLGKEPFNLLSELQRYRNFLVHYKRRYEQVGEFNGHPASKLEISLSEQFVRDLPSRLRSLIEKCCQAIGSPPPGWLIMQ